MDVITDPKLIASLFAAAGLIVAIALMIKNDRKFVTQLLGAILVVSISFSAHSTVVYTISVFVIATLVTELQFLEKIAALIWNRKEYWNYLSEYASKEDIEAKASAEVDIELAKEDVSGADEVEAVENIEQLPTGINDIEKATPSLDRKHMLLNALQFESSVLSAIDKGKIPFPYDYFRKEVRLNARGRDSIIDGIIETQGVHYLIEIKNITRLSSLVNAVHQVEAYKEIYENYLKERKIRATVQPLIIVPESVNFPNVFKGVPVAKYNSKLQEFENLKSAYLSYELNTVDNASSEELATLMRDFLSKYSKWAFSPLRIQKWGSRQAGFEKIALYTTNEIRQKLEDMLREGILEERTSQKDNKLYRIKP